MTTKHAESTKGLGYIYAACRVFRIGRSEGEGAGMAQWGEPSSPGFDFGPVTC